MSLSLVQIYCSANVLLLLGCTLMLCVRGVGSRLGRSLSYRHQLLCAYWLIAAAVTIPVLTSLVSHGDFLPATAQVWSGPSLQTLSHRVPGSHDAIVSLTLTGAQLRLDHVTQTIVAICLGGILLALCRIFSGSRSAYEVIAGAYLVRRRRSLRILVTTEASVPFSFWRPGASFIVVPQSLLTRPWDLRIALRHEAQHHRQGDTKLLYLGELLKGVFLLNPAAHLLSRWVRELQEFACDEAVVGHNPLSARSYCDCLLWVAQSSVAQQLPGFCMRMADPLLTRRIQVLLPAPRRPLHRLAAAVLVGVAVAIVLATGVVLAGTVQDRRVSAEQAHRMATTAQAQTSFPIVMNEQVLEEINRLLGTPDGRTFLHESLQRMQAHKDMIADKLSRGGLPLELLAVPLVESGYRNRPQDANPRHGAGLWMFIGSSARAYGLTVDETRDDRLDPALETDAAVQYFSKLSADFGDWGLALLAYNTGSSFVHQAISGAGTYDAFELARRDFQNDPHYVARVMAAIIVMKNAQ